MQADIARPLARTKGRRATARPLRILSTVALAALVAGCQAFQGAEATRTDADRGLSNAQLIERDIEAPEIFSTEDLALWDGRPSLGGVWVAATDVRQPERVIIRNPATGKQIVGALFKKEHPDDGLALMLSSDAAVALGIPAGQPTDISVTALRRREEPELPVADSEPYDVEGVTTAEDYLNDSTAEATESAAAAAVATTPLGEETDDDLAAGPLPDPSPVAAAAATVASVATDTVIDAVPTAEPTLLERIAAAVSATEAAEAAQPVAPAEAPETAATEAPAEAPLTIEALESALAAPVAATPLDTPATDVTATDVTPDTTAEAPAPLPDALAPVPSLDAQIAAAVAATEAAEASARADGRYVPIGRQPATGAAISTTSLDTAGLGPATGKEASRQYIQIGSYSTEAAAKATAEKFDSAGIATEVKQGGRVWRVLISGIQTVDQQSAALRKARDLGFGDAYPVNG